MSSFSIPWGRARARGTEVSCIGQTFWCFPNVSNIYLINKHTWGDVLKVSFGTGLSHPTTSDSFDSLLVFAWSLGDNVPQDL